MSATSISAGVSVARVRRATPVVHWLLAGAVLGAAAVMAFARFEMHMSAASVLTGSMRPAFSPGDAVVTRPVAVTSVRPGMVILATPAGETTAYAHRVVAVKHENGRVLVETRGDANPSPDSWRDVYAPTSRVSQVVGSVPMLGYVMQALQGHSSQSSVLPVAVAGTLLTFVACAFILFTGTTRRPSVVR
jgi:signal peptidase I